MGRAVIAPISDGSMFCTMRSVAPVVDASLLNGSSARPECILGKTFAEMRSMAHQISAHLVRRIANFRNQHQLWDFDRMCCQDEIASCASRAHPVRRLGVN